MRLVIGLLPMAQDRSRVPRDTIEKMAAEEGRFVVVVCMDGLPSRQVIQLSTRSRWPASQRPRPRHKADVLKGTGIDCIELGLASVHAYIPGYYSTPRDY